MEQSSSIDHITTWIDFMCIAGSEIRLHHPFFMKDAVKNEIFSISTGDRRISEPQGNYFLDCLWGSWLEVLFWSIQQVDPKRICHLMMCTFLVIIKINTLWPPTRRPLSFWKHLSKLGWITVTSLWNGALFKGIDLPTSFDHQVLS